jgi:DNA-binding transcriptional regulator YiaG
LQKESEEPMLDPKKLKDADVPKLIENFMTEERLTPSALASILNVAETTVHRWLRGEARPTGTAAAVLWTVIGIGGLAIGAAAVSSGLGIYRLLKKRLAGREEEIAKKVEAEKAKKEKAKRLQEIDALRKKLAEKEAELDKLEKVSREEE